MTTTNNSTVDTRNDSLCNNSGCHSYNVLNKEEYLLKYGSDGKNTEVSQMFKDSKFFTVICIECGT